MYIHTYVNSIVNCACVRASGRSGRPAERLGGVGTAKVAGRTVASLVYRSLGVVCKRQDSLS